MPRKTRKKQEKAKKPKKEAGKIALAIFTGESVYSNKKEAFTLYEQSRFGEPKEGKIIYSMFEALFLSEKGKLEIKEKSKKITFERLMEKAKTLDSRILTKYIVFKDMRNRGYVVKTALKFGAEFRVYDKGKTPGQEHAKWILYPVRESDFLTWHDFSAKNRVAHSTKKNLLIGIVDDENDVTYYEISWVKP
ncbi:MAG: tRNA-intron lyase [Nanoarchaeota archaeon]|nr:tRNA-intron lyase [Nanoarchaeota archaeon]MBU4086555.1 tRNA-intron lyase [Nanoarchaeota archaeon]